MITFENVTKTYDDGTTAVDSIDLEIADGSFTVFVGPSGCGKTTSMRMINKMITPTSGRVTVNGEDVTKVPSVKHRLGIGYVIQNAGLFPHRTVIDNVASVLRLKGVDKPAARKAAMEAIEQVRLPVALANRYPAQLSGGQQQRVGVARALAADPPILLMDEPFSAVDPVVRDELQQEMLRLQREIKKTIVFVTHDIDEALLLGDKIAVFAPGGVVVQYADAETVLTRPASASVANMIGRDRGFRALAFRDIAGIPVRPIGAADADGAFRPGNDWALHVDDQRRPTVWTLKEDVVQIGTTVKSGGSLRAALDAVLSSPTSLGVVVDDEGALVGLLAAEDVSQAIRSNPEGAAQ